MESRCTIQRKANVSFELLFVVYLAYGLAFLSMGLVLLLEAERTPSIELKHLLLPLSMFGVLHGLHEWLEMLALQAEHFGESLLEWVAWFRLGLLGASFIALWIYGLQAFQISRPYFSSFTAFGLITLPVYILVVTSDVLFAFVQERITGLQMVTALVRYLLGVPGAAVATLSLQARARYAGMHSRRPLARYLNGAALGFGLYSLTQFVVPRMDSFIASLINTESFAQTIGMPIQVFRTITAFLITLNLFRATQFLEEERRAQLAVAQRERLEALEREEAMRRELLRHVVRTQEEERARIARELHDELAQVLTAFSLDLETLRKQVPSRSKTSVLIHRLQDLSRQMSQSMHRLVHDLRPTHLDDLGLLSALKYLAEDSGRRWGLEVDFETEGQPRRVDSLAGTVLFRIAQEALVNVARHAQTKKACISLHYLPDEIVLHVSDPGVGFNPEEKFMPPRGWGLMGMKERAESAGGQFEVQSREGGGTSISVRVPLPRGEEE